MDDYDKQELANIGRAFREARERSGLSEREVADAVRGVSLAGVRAIEAGERPSLNYEQMIRLARVLGVEASEIISRAESLAAECSRTHRRDDLRRSGEQDARYAGRRLRGVPTGARADDRRGAWLGGCRW